MSTANEAPPEASSGRVLGPLAAAGLALAGSLWLSVGMGLKACPLCFYQRTFVMSIVAVLGLGLLTARRHWGVLNLLALPLAVAGFAVAAYHVYLELAGKLECPLGVLGIGTAPQQSLAALAAVLATIVASLRPGSVPGAFHRAAPAAAVVLGLLLAGGAVISAPPMPPTPTKAYDKPMDTCRPPFHPA